MRVPGVQLLTLAQNVCVSIYMSMCVCIYVCLTRLRIPCIEILSPFRMGKSAVLFTSLKLHQEIYKQVLQTSFFLV